MPIKRIKAVLLQEYYVTKRSMEVMFDIFIFSLISLFLFGFLSAYLTGEENAQAAQYILLGMLFWEIVRVMQYSIVMGSMWNMWSRNLSNMFISPMTAAEFLIAQTVSGFAKALLVFLINSVVVIVVFHFSVFVLGPVIIVYILSFSIFAFAAGIIILGIIYRFGTRIQAFAWGLLPILQPITAAFFPVDVLPYPLQIISKLFPSTHIFEAVRYHLDTGLVDWQGLIMSLILNVLFVTAGILYFSRMYDISRNNGQFARNES